MIALSLLLVLAQSPLDKKVSPDFGAMQAKVLIKELSTTAGVQLEVAPPMATEVVVLRAKDVPVSEVMDKLANVLHGKWTKTREGYLLGRPQEVQQELNARDLRMRTQMIEKALEADFERIAKYKSPRERAEAVFKTWDQIKRARENKEPVFDTFFDSPADQLMIKLAKQIGAAEFARAGEFDRYAYSDKPNTYQRLMPVGYKGLVAEYSQTEEALRGLSEPAGPKGFDEWQVPYIFGAAYNEKPIDKVVLSFYGSDRGGFLHLGVYSPDGQARSLAGRALRYDAEFVGFQLVNKDEELERLKQAGKGKKVPLPPIGRELSEIGAPGKGSVPVEAIPRDTIISSEAIDFVLHPEDKDPLSLMVGPAVDALASDKGPMLCASLSDELYFNLRRAIRDGAVDLGQLEVLLPRSGRTEVKTEGKWMLLRPFNPVASERNRVNRPALGRHVREAQGAGVFTVRNIGKFFYAGGPGARSFLIKPHYERILLEGGLRHDASLSTIPPRFGALLGSLTDAQWRTLETAGQLDCWSLSSGQKPYLRFAPARFYRNEDETGQEAVDRILDPTELLFPSNGNGVFLTMKLEPMEMVLDAEKGGPFSSIATSLGEVGQRAAWMAKEQRVDSIDKVLTGNYSVGARKLVTYNIRLTSSAGHWFVAAGDREMSKTTYKYTDLPEAVRKAIETAFTKEMAGGGQ